MAARGSRVLAYCPSTGRWASASRTPTPRDDTGTSPPPERAAKGISEPLNCIGFALVLAVVCIAIHVRIPPIVISEIASS